MKQPHETTAQPHMHVQGPLTVISLNGCVIRETLDGRATNSVEKSCWLNLCCTTPDGLCVGGSVAPDDMCAPSSVDNSMYVDESIADDRIVDGSK